MSRATFERLALDLARPGALEVLVDAAAERGWAVIEVDCLSLPHSVWAAPVSDSRVPTWWAEGVWFGRDVISAVREQGAGLLRYPPAARSQVRDRVHRLELHRREGVRLHTWDGRLVIDRGTHLTHVFSRLLASIPDLADPRDFAVLAEWLLSNDQALVFREGPWFGREMYPSLWLPVVSHAP